MRSDLYEPLAEFLSKHIGLHFPMERMADLDRGMTSAAREFGCEDGEACARWLLSEEPERNRMEAIASHLTVGETYFFRDRNIFNALEHEVLPELLRTRSVIRIWSAGCCTGEEPYSIAMLLDRLAPNHGGIWILATDINPRFLEKASRGIYGEWSFRDAPPRIRENYFREMGKGYEILPRIRKMVNFSCLNLAEDPYPKGMDIVFCRNVLMYFSQERRESTAAGLHEAISEDGWLIVSPTEASDGLFSSFEHVGFPEATFYRKSAGKREIIAEAFEDVRISEAMTGTLEERPDADECIVAERCAGRGNLIEAKGWCEKAIALDPLDPKRHFLHAVILHEMGDFGEEENALRKTIYLEPGFILAHFSLGNLCLSQWRGVEGRRHFENSLTLLEKLPREEILTGSDGLSAGRLAEIIGKLIGRGAREGG